jgi:hypothetical protein
MQITTLANVKETLSIQTSNTGDDVRINSFVIAVSSAIEKHLMRFIEIMERTQYFDVDRSSKEFYLKAYPITAISVSNDYGRDFTTEISAENYTIRGGNGRLVIDRQTLTEGFDVLRVVYTGGLASNQAALQLACPDLEMAARIQCALWYKMKDSINLTSQAVQGVGQTNYKPLKLDAAVVEMLDQYRNKSYV